MPFEITHTTSYQYTQPSMEAYLEARLTPPSTLHQTVSSHRMTFSPAAPLSAYQDAFGNTVHCYAMTLRHNRLVVKNHLIATPHYQPPSPEALSLSIAEVQQLFASNPVRIDYFDYLRPTPNIPLGGSAITWAKRYLNPSRPLGEGLHLLNQAIYHGFTYQPGTTSNTTPLQTVWKERRGVCQDYTHIMLSVLRTAHLPARYVCGYIEAAATDPSALEPPTPITSVPFQIDFPKKRATKQRKALPIHSNQPTLVGSLATHAWVEVLIPGLQWIALDPTNNQWCRNQHIALTFGRDFEDAAPLRGSFKGTGKQRLRVKVQVKRTELTS